jgi:acetyl esterase/lipase
MEASFDDVAEAVLFVKANHREYHLDPERVVVGGFSAGGRCASYVAYGKRIGVAGVVSLSGPMLPADAEAYLTSAPEGFSQPPLLMFYAEHDLDYVRSFSPELERLFLTYGQEVESIFVPGENHFYPHESRTEGGRAVFDVMHESVIKWVGRPSSN